MTECLSVMVANAMPLDLITTEPPGYALHRWDGVNLVSHYEEVSGWRAIAHYSGSLQAMIQDMFAERE